MRILLAFVALCLPLSITAPSQAYAAEKPPISGEAAQLRTEFNVGAKAPTATQILNLLTQSHYWTCTAHGASLEGPWEIFTVHPNYFRFLARGNEIINTTRPNEKFQIIAEGLAGNRSTKDPTKNTWYTDAYHLIRFAADNRFLAEVLFVNSQHQPYPKSAVLKNLDHLAVRAYLDCWEQ